MENLEIVRKLYELFTNRNNEEVRNIFANNILWNQMNGFLKGGQFIGTNAVFNKVFKPLTQN